MELCPIPNLPKEGAVYGTEEQLSKIKNVFLLHNYRGNRTTKKTKGVAWNERSFWTVFSSHKPTYPIEDIIDIMYKVEEDKTEPLDVEKDIQNQSYNLNNLILW